MDLFCLGLFEVISFASQHEQRAYLAASTILPKRLVPSLATALTVWLRLRAFIFPAGLLIAFSRGDVPREVDERRRRREFACGCRLLFDFGETTTDGLRTRSADGLSWMSWASEEMKAFGREVMWLCGLALCLIPLRVPGACASAPLLHVRCVLASPRVCLEMAGNHRVGTCLSLFFSFFRPSRVVGSRADWALELLLGMSTISTLDKTVLLILLCFLESEVQRWRLKIIQS